MTNILKEAAFAHDSAALLAMELVVPPDCMLPLQKNSYMQMPTIAGHIAFAQATGRPMLLHYAGNPALPYPSGNPRPNPNRNSACRGWVAPPPPNTSCDEYPYASTLEGGANASTMGVPPAEQSTQGGVLSIFYDRFGMLPSRFGPGGNEFAAVVVLFGFF
jgi:hypothetical protein